MIRSQSRYSCGWDFFFFELQASFFIPLWFASPLFYEEDKSICISIEKRIENHLQSIKEGLDLLEEGTEKHKGL